MNYNFEIMLSLLLQPCSGSAVRKPFSHCSLHHFLHKANVTEISAAVVQMLDVFDALSLNSLLTKHIKQHIALQAFLQTIGKGQPLFAAR